MSTITINKTITFISTKANRNDASVPPQAQIVMMKIVELCNKILGNSTTQDAIIHSLNENDLHTKQSVKRIVCYYLPLLRDLGFINYESSRGGSFTIEL